MKLAKREKDKRSGNARLRQRAIDKLQGAPIAAASGLIATDIHKQLHALQVHQIELEMQNAELQQMRTDLESSLARYTDLYDFAPIGYFTLDRKGVILEANLTSADLLGMLRAELIGKHFKRFVLDASEAAFDAFLYRVFASKAKETCELPVLDEQKQAFFVHIEATAEISGQTCRVAILDINKRKLTEVALQQSQEALRELAAHQEDVKENERKRIAREIHDDLGQNLLALRIDIAMLNDRTRHSHPRLNKKTEAALAHLDATIKAVRLAINNLHPAVLDLGLIAALEWQVQDFQRRNKIEIDLVMGEINITHDDNLAIALFRILQESLNNVIRHAKATRVRIALCIEDNKLFMKIADNGIGIFPECRRKANAFGLMGIEERVRALSGELIVESGQAQGTKLTVAIPLPGMAGKDSPGDRR
ncbi:MAG TPA: histidine kinase [Paucimonas sp.]|nr:histidine kinase [Paucimonas sp.]